MGVIENWRRRRVLKRRPIANSAWQSTLAELPILQGLDPHELARLRDWATLFLYDKTFEPVQGLTLDTHQRLLIAAQACLPILHLDIDWYAGWSAVIVYPGEFAAPRERLDADGVVHVRHEALSGESWSHGGILLSWEDIAYAGRCDGDNVIIHELAHKLDMLNGDANGFPPLHRGMTSRAWSEAFSAAFEDIGARVDAGEDTAIDPYASEDPGECFAVFSEYFFERPRLLQSQYPSVYDQLRLFYRQDPAQRLYR